MAQSSLHSSALKMPYGSIGGHEQELPQSNSNTVASSDSESSFLVPIHKHGTGASSPYQGLTQRLVKWIGCCSSASSLARRGIASTNPSHNQKNKHERNSVAADLRLSVLSNFSTAYNVLSISLALDILAKQHPNLTTADKSLCSSALFAGMIVGQLGGGALGDMLGRHMAMTVVMLLQVCAALISSLSCDISLGADVLPWAAEGGIHISLFSVLAFWRFVLGLGCGGVYPLAATLTAESHGEDNTQQDGPADETAKAKRVALAFSFQGVGYLTVPATAWLIVSVLDEQTSDLAWRLLLGLGALPGIFLTTSRVHNNVQHSAPPRPLPPTKMTEAAQNPPHSVLEAIRREPELLRKMLGAGGCWFLFDILFYGNTLFQPIVLGCAFGTEEETVHKAARDSALIALMALPGYYVSVLMVGRQTPRYIQLQGFLVMAVLYACIALLFDQMSNNRVLLLTVYGSTFFFSNYGPNATTFMMPAMTFSKHCRSTLNGACAACGKVGALVGATVFATSVQRYGQSPVFWTCSSLCLVGFFVTKVCVTCSHAVKEQLILAEVLEEGQAASLKDKPNHAKRIPSVYSMPSIFDFHEGNTRNQ